MAVVTIVSVVAVVAVVPVVIGLRDGLAAGITEQRAAVNGLACLPIGVLVSRIARVATLAIIVAGAGALVGGVGRSGLSTRGGGAHDGSAIAITKHRAAINSLASLPIGVLMSRVA